MEDTLSYPPLPPPSTSRSLPPRENALETSEPFVPTASDPSSSAAYNLPISSPPPRDLEPFIQLPFEAPWRIPDEPALSSQNFSSQSTTEPNTPSSVRYHHDSGHIQNEPRSSSQIPNPTLTNPTPSQVRHEDGSGHIQNEPPPNSQNVYFQPRESTPYPYPLARPDNDSEDEIGELLVTERHSGAERSAGEGKGKARARVTDADGDVEEVEVVAASGPLGSGSSPTTRASKKGKARAREEHDQQGPSKRIKMEEIDPSKPATSSSSSPSKLLQSLDAATGFAPITDSKPGSSSTAVFEPVKKEPEREPMSAFTCPICFYPPTNATLTPCGHVCCGKCLFTAVKTTLSRGGGIVGYGENLPRCPVCRAPIPGWDGRGGGVIGLKIGVGYGKA